MPENTKTDEKEEEIGVGEEMDFENPAYTFIPNGVHTYRQQGFYLVCKSCDLGHAVHIGREKVMVGEDEEGKPILKSRKEVGL